MRAGHRFLPLSRVQFNVALGWAHANLRKLDFFHTYRHAYGCICMPIVAYECICKFLHAYACVCMLMHANACICMHVQAYARI